MSSKMMGLIFIAAGVAIAAFLWVLTQKKAPETIRGKTRRYRLRHEYSNKGFTEKGQSEGIMNVPNDQSDLKDSYSEQNLFDNSKSESNNIHPGDTF